MAFLQILVLIVLVTNTPCHGLESNPNKHKGKKGGGHGGGGHGGGGGGGGGKKAATTTAAPSLDEWKKKQEGAQSAKEAAAAKEANMAGVNKVTSMLEDLQIQVMAEGEKEAAGYNKFSCFCKDTTAEKTKAVSKGQDQKMSLIATINDYVTARDELDELIKTTMEDIEAAEKFMKETTDERKRNLAIYEMNEADLAGAIASLEAAIPVLKGSKSPSFLQVQDVQATLRTAALMSDALGLRGASALTSFLQQAPDVPMENYNFHSGGIIEMLEQLLSDFRAQKEGVDADEVKSVAAYQKIMQEKTDYLKAKNLKLEQAQKDKTTKIEEISAANQELTTVSATLLDDQEYLAELTVVCTNKAKTWDQRSQVRADEIGALTTAIGIIKTTVSDRTAAGTVRLAQQALSVHLAKQVAGNPDAMDAVEAEAEAVEASPSFLQRRSTKGQLAAKPDEVRQLVADLLRNKGQQLKSTVLVALATKIGADPLAKVKILIQELIQRLLQEAANEANQKGWCDKAMGDAEQKRDLAAEEIEELNSEMASLEARNDKLAEQLKDLADTLEREKYEQMNTHLEREMEKAENDATILEAKSGLIAINQAIDILDKFYKTAAKSKVEGGEFTYAPAPAPSLLQISASSIATAKKQPVIDAPDAGFENFEAYTGASGAQGGIVGMMEVIQSDFERTIKETEKAERAAEKDFMEFMIESGKSLAEKEFAETEFTRQKDEAEEELDAAKDSFESNTGILKGAISELIELKPQCIDTGMSYEERVARREEEIEALHKALCVLENFQKFGPDGASDGC